MLADRWHTCLFDLDGNQGLLGRQVQGRTAADAAYWLAGATPAWRDAVQVASIDMCSSYAAAIRRMLAMPTAQERGTDSNRTERQIPVNLEGPIAAGHKPRQPAHIPARNMINLR